MRHCLFFLLTIATLAEVSAQSKKQKWVDSVFNQLDESQKIGQLFMIPVSSYAKDNLLGDIADKIENQYIGGIAFTTGHPLKQASITNRFQSAASVPLLIAQDASSGIGTYLDSVLAFPPPIAQAAFASDTATYLMSKEIAKQLRLLGVNINLGPTANLANHNGIAYNQNTYGENKETVSRKAVAFMAGMLSEGILTCAKHFPIQGITVSDVQNGLPILQPYVDSIQAYPFQQLFKYGLPAVMPASSELPLFYVSKKAARKNKFSSVELSSFFTGDWLERQMGFNGLVIVDIQSLEGNSKKFRSGDAELFGFQAGNDLLITNGNVNIAIRKIKRLLKSETQYIYQLNNSVRKILAAKYDAGLAKKTMADVDNLMSQLNNTDVQILQRNLFQSAATIVKNQNNTLPLISLENRKFACVFTDDTPAGNAFRELIGKYVHTSKYVVRNEEDATDLDQKLTDKQVVIVTLSPTTAEPVLQKLAQIQQSRKGELEIIVADFGCPLLSKYIVNFPTVVTGYTPSPEMSGIIVEVIFGALPSNSVVPLSLGDVIAGTRSRTKSLSRLQYSIPEDAGMNSKTLERIEAIAKEAIDSKATPGCHVLVAKKGKVVYEKSFGYLTYENQFPVTDSTIYDLASVTKVAATLQTVMFMHDRGLVDLNKKASFYLPELKKSNKKDFTLKDILTHQAGLWPFLPFWSLTMKDSNPLPVFYNDKPTLQYPYMVADKLYAASFMKDTLWTWIIKAKIREKPARTPFDYRYSDMGFYIAQRLAEKILNQPIEDFLEQNLYEPLGARTTGYLPLLRFPIRQIAPTENDKLFRKALLIGTVHDQGAAMLGGTAGHAGLFSNANDLAKLCQMLLQEGYYGGYQYYKPETVRLFAQKQFETSRRGLGWDKPVLSDSNSPTSRFASPKTFGHTGFTGTCIWIDPEFDLVYIFLSNRVHPDMTNNKLLNANIRSRIQDVVYQSIFDYAKTSKDEPITISKSE